MFPSSSRVKLNRVALKDVVGLQLVPRRRRVQKSPENVPAKKRVDKHQFLSMKDTAYVLGSNEPVCADYWRPHNATEVVSSVDEVEPEDRRVGTLKALGRHCGQSRRQGDNMEMKQQRPDSGDTPPRHAGSEESLRRPVTPFGSRLCGDCRYKSPQNIILGKQVQKSSSPGPEQSETELKIKKGNPETENSKKIIVWIDQYPKVALCDVAQKCDVCSHKCSYLIPDDLKTKVVHCFKQEIRAGFLFRPACSGHNEHKSEDSALTNDSKSDASTCQSQSVAKHLKEHTDSELSSHSTYHFVKGWTSEASAVFPTSLLSKQENKGKRRTSMWDRDVERPGPGCDLIGAELHRDKRMKFGDNVKDGSLPPSQHLRSVNCGEVAKTYLGNINKSCCAMPGGRQSSLEPTFGSCSTYRLTVKEGCVHEEPYGRIGQPRETNSAQMPSELLCERNEVDADDLESFTCQRVRVYCKKINSTCARTDMPWPFSNSSRALPAHAGSTTCPTEPVQPSTRYSDSPMNQNQSSSLGSRTKDVLSSTTTTNQVSPQNKDKQEKNGECIIDKSNGERDVHMSSHSSGIRNTEFTATFMDAEESLVTPPSASSTSVNRPETDSSRSTPSPSALGLSDWETVAAFSPMSALLTYGGLSSLPTTPSSNPPSLFRFEKVKSVHLAEGHSASMSPTSPSLSCFINAVETPLFHCEETQNTFYGSSPRPSSITNNSDSFPSCESSLLLPQDEQGSDKDFFIERSPPILEPYFKTRPLICNRPVAALPYGTKEQCEESNSTESILPPLLSPVTTPQRRQLFSFPPQSQYSSDEAAVEKEEEATNKHTSKLKILPGYSMPQLGNGTRQNCEASPDNQCEKSGQDEELEGVPSTPKSPLSQSSVGDESVAMEEESPDESDYEDDLQQGNRSSEQVPLAPNIKSSRASGVVTEPCSSPSSDEEQPCSTRDEESSPSETGGSESDKTEAEAAGGAHSGLLDEFTAYEQDILLLDVVQDDPELFENVPKGMLLKLGPTRVSDAPKTIPTAMVKMVSPRIGGASPGVNQRLTPVIVNFRCDSPDITEESESRSWRPQCSSTTPKMQNNTWPARDKQTRTMGQSDANNNHVNGGMERNHPIQTVNTYNIPPLMTMRNVSRITSPANMTDFRRQKSNSYCRQYFSESLSCGFKMCRFQHVPVEGDEKFCVETVMRFIKNPMCLQKAKAVFTGYYLNNPPGVYFSLPVLLTLLSALLKAGLVSDIFSVLSVSLAHKIVPTYEFLLALFNFVREKGLTGSVPELMQLTFKMASAGLSLDSFDCVKNTPEFQQVVSPTSLGSQRLSTSAPEYLNLTHSIVEIELCAKQEDWRTMGKVFRSMYHSSHHPNQLEQISGSIAIALLSESKDKLSVPFAPFAETVCQNENEDSLLRSFLGRIGVSLMLRYYKTCQWDKGRRVVEVLSNSKVNYSTLKGLFGNEDSASRCCLITRATEFFLRSNSVEGALSTLRENNWFLSSSSWPCEPEDLDSRSCVLRCLAERTSHRDTLDVLRNLPGIKEPNDLIDISRYSPLFSSHLQLCMERQILPVASDTVDFMLSKNLSVDHAVLQTLLHKLGKQNLWLRAREVFRHSLSVGYYTDVSAPPGVMALIVPWRLEEVELALTYEMFITVNAVAILRLLETTTACLSITLKRTESGESEYLSAGSRLLSAACIPQPKLIVHYTAVNSSQEQVFTLDIPSARRWLRHNHLWANEMWKH